MHRIVVLDTSPLGLISNPKSTPENLLCNPWLRVLLAERIRVMIPEIADFELRRELIRAGKVKGIARLDSLVTFLEYDPITTQTMRLAAELWAQARKRGRPTAADAGLDADVIIAAQALTLGSDEEVIVATTNAKHLDPFVTAKHWNQIHTK